MTPTHRRGAALGVVLALGACGGVSDPRGSTSTTPATRSAAPAPPETSGFVVFGDFGGGPAQQAVADAMERWTADHDVDALVTTGDNVYNHGEPELFAAHLDEPYADLRRTRPLWVTLGNHDVDQGFGDDQLDHLGLPDLPYAKELPGVQLLFLDGNRPDDEQAGWLDRRLSEPGPRLRVVVMHQPAYSCSTHGATPGVQVNWVPVIEDHRVALVLAGHDHLYERFTTGGVTYVVTGGGGRPLYPFGEPCRFEGILDTYAEVHHFLAVEVSGRSMTGTAVATDGRVLDRFEIHR